MKKIFNEYTLTLLAFVTSVIGISIFLNLILNGRLEGLINSALYIK